MIKQINFTDRRLDTAGIEYILSHSEKEIFEIVRQEWHNKCDGQTAVFQLVCYFDAVCFIEDIKTRDRLRTKLAWTIFLATINSSLNHVILSDRDNPYNVPRVQLLQNLDRHMAKNDPDTWAEVKLVRNINEEPTEEHEKQFIYFRRTLRALNYIWDPNRHSLLGRGQLTNPLEINYKKFCGYFPQLHEVHSHQTPEPVVVIRPSIFLGTLLDLNTNGDGDPYDFFSFPIEPEYQYLVWNSNYSFFGYPRNSDALKVFIAMLDWNNNPQRFLKVINEGRDQRMSNGELSEIVEHLKKNFTAQTLFPETLKMKGVVLPETGDVPKIIKNPFSKMTDTNWSIISPKPSYSYERGIEICKQKVGDSDCYFFNRKENSGYKKQIKYIVVLDQDIKQLDPSAIIYG